MLKKVIPILKLGAAKTGIDRLLLLKISLKSPFPVEATIKQAPISSHFSLIFIKSSEVEQSITTSASVRSFKSEMI